MKAVTHGVMVAGVSSAISAAWIRQRVVSSYDPASTPPSLRNILYDRVPLAIAGLGFTGLSALVAQQFDRRELEILADHGSDTPVYQQLDKHRVLHSLPYVGSAVLAARLIRYAGAEVGEWVAAKLHLGERATEITEALVDMADWVIHSLGTGVTGHILGDLPTKGTLRLLKPISYDNFALRLVAHDNPTVNSYLQSAGWLLTGASWAVSGLYLLSWEPPETRIQSYLRKMAEQGSVSGAMQLAQADIGRLFAYLLDRSREVFWNLPLFRSKSQGKDQYWFEMGFDTSIWGVDELSTVSLRKQGILPESLGALFDEKSIHSIETFNLDAPLSSVTVGSALEVELSSTNNEKSAEMVDEDTTDASIRKTEELESSSSDDNDDLTSFSRD